MSDFSQITVGNKVRFMQNVWMHAAEHELCDTGRHVDVANNVRIGASAVYPQGVKGGANAIVVAGSLLNRDVPDKETAADFSAVVIRHRGARV